MIKKLTLLLLAVLPAIVWSQPIVKNAEDFSIGTVLKFQKCDPTSVSVGNAGANQTWDFSNLVTVADTTTEWMVLPSSTTNGSAFPSANLCEKYSDGRFIYVNKTLNENYLVGFVDTTAAFPPTSYPNPMLFAKRPLNYGTIIKDTFTMTGSSANGIVTINPDAYGTLILPNGTHNNVLRVKITEVHPFFNFTVYVWFNGINTSALLKIDDQPNVEYLLNETTTSIAKIEKSIKTTLYPNPCFTQTILHTENNLKNASLMVYNSMGVKVKEVKNISGQTATFFRDNLPSGLYFLSLTEDNKVISVEKLLIAD